MVCCVPGPQQCPKAHKASPPVLLGVLGSEPASDGLLSLRALLLEWGWLLARAMGCQSRVPRHSAGRPASSHGAVQAPETGREKPRCIGCGPKPGTNSRAGAGGAPAEWEGLEGHMVTKSLG